MKIRAIRFPEGGEERMGKIVNRSNSRPTGKYPSWKMGRMMQWKTVAHLNAFRLLDADSRVSSFQELPMAIEYESKGVFKVEHPDLLVVIGAHKELWTINKLSTAHSQAQKNEMKELAIHLLAHGYRQRLTAIKPDLEVRVLKKSVSQFSEKFIGKESLSKLLALMRMNSVEESSWRECQHLISHLVTVLIATHLFQKYLSQGWQVTFDPRYGECPTFSIN